MSDWVTVAKRGAARKKEQDEQAAKNEIADSLLDMQAPGPVILVVDSAAIIKGLKLGAGNVELYTVPEVLNEIRDKKARQQLETMPFELKSREPSAEHVAAVIAFSKKTGDFRWLSAADVKVLALTRMFEVERNGGAVLRATPQPILTNPKPSAIDVATTSTTSGTDTQPSAAKSGAQESAAFDIVSENVQQIELDDDDDTDNHEHQSNASEHHDDGNDVKNTDDDDEDDEDPDAGEWINQDNISRVIAKARYGVEEPEAAVAVDTVRVGCITADFAMQNVLVQMGLRLVSCDGMLIKRAQQSLLRCFACTQLVRDVEKLFCPACGNATLKRVSVAVDCDGGVTRVYFSKKPLATRGTRFALPMPRGGRNDKGDIVLSEADLMRKTQHKHKPKTSELDGTEGAEFGAVNQFGTFKGVKIGVGRKNPNVARKKFGKRNEPRQRHT